MLVWRLRTGAYGVGACGFLALSNAPLKFDYVYQLEAVEEFSALNFLSKEFTYAPGPAFSSSSNKARAKIRVLPVLGSYISPRILLLRVGPDFARLRREPIDGTRETLFAFYSVIGKLPLLSSPQQPQLERGTITKLKCAPLPAAATSGIAFGARKPEQKSYTTTRNLVRGRDGEGEAKEREDEVAATQWRQRPTDQWGRSPRNRPRSAPFTIFLFLFRLATVAIACYWPSPGITDFNLVFGWDGRSILRAGYSNRGRPSGLPTSAAR